MNPMKILASLLHLFDVLCVLDLKNKTENLKEYLDDDTTETVCQLLISNGFVEVLLKDLMNQSIPKVFQFCSVNIPQ